MILRNLSEFFKDLEDFEVFLCFGQSPAESFFSKVKHAANGPEMGQGGHRRSARSVAAPQRRRRKAVSIPEPNDSNSSNDDEFGALSDSSNGSGDEFERRVRRRQSVDNTMD